MFYAKPTFFQSFENYCWANNKEKMVCFYLQSLTVIIFSQEGFVYFFWAVKSAKRKTPQSKSQIHEGTFSIIAYWELDGF